jgi:cytochrome c oxidase, subunit IV
MNEQVIRLLLVYLALSNLLSLSLFGIDKWKAKHTKWRISEKTLLLVAAIGGSIGAWVGMKLWHHKTQHKKFKYGVPLIFIIQLAALLFASYKIYCA